MNRSSFFSLAACRTRLRPWDAPSRPGVRSVSSAFSLAPAHGSTGSLGRSPASFVGFTATIVGPDLSRPCIIGFGSSPSRRGPSARAPAARREISRFPDEELARMPGSATSRDRRCARVDAHSRVAFRRDKSVGVPIDNFAAQWLPMQSPADASPSASRPKTYGSGPVRIATLSPRWTGATYSLPAFRRTVTVIAAEIIS